VISKSSVVGVLWQCKDKGDLTIWFDLAGVAKTE
jgi:hypothetical protein